MGALYVRQVSPVDLEVHISLTDSEPVVDILYNVTICGFAPPLGTCVETNNKVIPRSGAVTVSYLLRWHYLVFHCAVGIKH